VDSGYSGTPLAQKLGYRPGLRVLLLGAPPEYSSWLGPASLDAEFCELAKLEAGGAGLIHFFVSSASVLRGQLTELLPLLEERGMLWVSWPKKAVAKKLGIDTDITEGTIRDIALPLGLVDVKVCAVSEVWSGLKLVRRREP
jgi:hypothetical protein